MDNLFQQSIYMLIKKIFNLKYK